MDKTENNGKNTTGDDAPQELNTPKPKAKPRGKKRKRRDSESSTDIEDILPDNALEVEQNLHASAIKNNLDDVSVKKILKKVVTNDHVLALVKLREEEEDSSAEERGLQPKLTRAKVKELMKVSPKSSRWNLENLALTPIKHIPVKTRPEVKALIAHELHEDEEDDEYEPTVDDVPSDDDQTLESCSDLDSQPRTPATPSSRAISPRVVKDGPFKVPQEITTPTRRKLVIVEEEATIALRTRSKLSLSATPIEHIESSFVPPDDIPTPRDDLWDQFLEECLNPTSVTKTEEDDEADPEYNVAADPDAHDEDEEALENSIIKISKKELNDLVTELFSIMPEDTNADELAENLAKKVLTDTEQTDLTNMNEQNKIQNHWDGKQEVVSDEETEAQVKPSVLQKRDRLTRISIGKSEVEDPEYRDASESATDKDKSSSKEKEREAVQPKITVVNKPTAVSISVVEQNFTVQPPPVLNGQPPPLLRCMQPKTDRLDVYLNEPGCILPQQTLILQQQLRQHIQLATSNFLQLYVNPTHWALAHTYKDYLNQLDKMLETNPSSVANVCNLKPAIELITSWENSVSEDTPENKKLVERRRFNQNSLYVGDFPDQLMEVVANSCVFLYPYLLPAMPYRPDTNRKFGYRRSEDNLIVLGLDQFWQYVEDNPQMFKPPERPHPRYRWGLAATATLVCKHMLPWIPPRLLLAHIHKSRKEQDNPIHAFFEKREVKYLKHKLLPFNPNLTLYEQPEYEMPRIWTRYLAKSSKRFRDHLFRRRNSGLPPQGGVPVNLEKTIDVPNKNPLPIDFTKVIVCNRANMHPKILIEPLKDKFDIEVEKVDGENKAAVTNNVPGELKVITGELPPGTKVLGNITANGNFLVIANASNAAVNTIVDNTQNMPGKLIGAGNISAGNETNTNTSENNMPAGNMIISNIGTGNTLPSGKIIPVGNMSAVNVAANANKDHNIPAGNMITVSNIGANANTQGTTLPPGKLIPVRNIAALNMSANANGTGSSKPANISAAKKMVVNLPKKNRITAKNIPAAKTVGNVGAGKVSILKHKIIKNLPSGKMIKISNILKNNNVTSNAGNVPKTLPVGNLIPIANTATRGNVCQQTASQFGGAKNNVTIKPVGTVRGIPTITAGNTAHVNTTTNITAANRVTSGNVATGNEVTANNLIATVNNQSQTVASNNVNDANAQNLVISSNMYRVVETSVGAYLVPITILQVPSTVNSGNGIAGTVPHETVPNDVLVMTHNKRRSKSASSFDHCQCCLLIRKICKRQTVITDFFKTKTEEVEKCECTDRRYPRMSNKLRLLITNYKDHSWSVHKKLQRKLDEGNKDKSNNEMDVDTQCSLEDIASVTSYQLKLTIRTSIIRNTYTKKRLNTLFSRFDPYSDDPVNLSKELFKVFGVELVDLYKEFLGFLTAEQAERIDGFKDYFVHNCVPHLIKKIEDEISDKDRRCRILSYLSEMTVGNASTSCEMCAGLLASLTDHPRLAQYVFSLFPHRISDKKKKDDRSTIHSELHYETKMNEIEKDTEDIDQNAQSGSETENELEMEGHFEDDTLTPCNVMDYEADHSSSGEDENRQSVTLRLTVETPSIAMTDIKHEVPHLENEPNTQKSPVTKTEDSDDFCDSTMSTMVMSEDEPVKSEVAEWKRDEDKLILEVLLHHITPEVRKEKTILEILDEKSVYEILGESLPHKSVSDIRDRVMYLLEILLLSEY